MPSLDILVRYVQLRHRLGLIDDLAHARFRTNLPDARNQVLHLVLLLLLDGGDDVDFVLARVGSGARRIIV